MQKVFVQDDDGYCAMAKGEEYRTKPTSHNHSATSFPCEYLRLPATNSVVQHVAEQ